MTNSFSNWKKEPTPPSTVLSSILPPFPTESSIPPDDSSLLFNETSRHAIVVAYPADTRLIAANISKIFFIFLKISFLY